MVSRILLLFAALLAFPSSASAQDVEGTWALRIDDAIIYVFDLDRVDDMRWEGSWTRPAEMQNNGLIFSELSGERQHRLLSTTETATFVEFLFEGDRVGGVPQVFRIVPGETDRALLTQIGSGHDPYPLVRVDAGTAIGPFSPLRIYDRDNAVSDPALPMGELRDELAVQGRDEIGRPPAGEQSGASSSRMSRDFLGDRAEGDGAPIVASSEPRQDMSRSCSDFSRENPPSLDELTERWGDDYVTVGEGLDIRDYTMDDGRIFRMTVLDDRVFANGCRRAN